jgi:hypothetical protein
MRQDYPDLTPLKHQECKGVRRPVVSGLFFTSGAKNLHRLPQAYAYGVGYVHQHPTYYFACCHRLWAVHVPGHQRKYFPDESQAMFEWCLTFRDRCDLEVVLRPVWFVKFFKVHMCYRSTNILAKLAAEVSNRATLRVNTHLPPPAEEHEQSAPTQRTGPIILLTTIREERGLRAFFGIAMSDMHPLLHVRSCEATRSR